MKKTIFTLLLFATANFTFAQQKYYPFSINGKHGITDTLGNEVMKPTYAFTTLVPAKNQFYLQDFSERPDIIFNTKTGTKALYESIYNNEVQIKNVPYAMVTAKGKKFLLSEETDKAIPLTRDYGDFYAVGNYIIANYHAQDTYVSGGKDKNGKFLPPKIREMKKHHVVLANDESLKMVLDKGFDKYLPLYILPAEKKDDGIVKMKTITIDLRKKKSNPIFDYIILSQGNNHRLFNAKMVLVKAFVLAKLDEDKLFDYAEKLLNVKLSTMPNVENSFVSAPKMAEPTYSQQKGVNPEPQEEIAVEKEPFIPFFYAKKLENGNTIFALQETEEISKRIFETKPTTKLTFYKADNYFDVKIEGKEDSRTYFNRKTGEIYLPKAYLAGLGITLN
ncbi:hypothetical protein [Pedobacter cryotolerans]|uniref:Copper amine oxidase-like N-terminal domain-containing protein n=1 Tax=Pedobacter cryotolerans TaxID=2571270 RepID=A0A4U1C893_9SPHI|nr:hypothetical protein [Pedobacter cryotolerans]TKC01761.1 hypothetical protein FA045_05780 [Pedobacter cryotolerans]